MTVPGPLRGALARASGQSRSDESDRDRRARDSRRRQYCAEPFRSARYIFTTMMNVCEPLPVLLVASIVDT